MIVTLKKKKLFTGLGTVCCVVFLAGCGAQKVHHHAKDYHIDSTKRVSQIQREHPNNRTVNYKKSSEKIPYPKLNSKHNRAFVSIAKQRVYLQKRVGKTWKTVYTMYASTGSHNKTPRGKYRIQNVRGNYFYSPKEHEGARYYVSWKDNGVYLFHGTPNNKKKQVNQQVARDLGKRPSSHGCIHLTIPDAKWFSSHAPIGMPVIIK